MDGRIRLAGPTIYEEVVEVSLVVSCAITSSALSFNGTDRTFFDFAISAGIRTQGVVRRCSSECLLRGFSFLYLRTLLKGADHIYLVSQWQ